MATNIAAVRAHLARLPARGGGQARDLSIGAWRLRFEGLEGQLAATLDARWGGFAGPAKGASPTASVLVRWADEDLWLARAAPGEGYRLETTLAGGPVLVRSYAFALTETAEGCWALALARGRSEPPGRTMDNAARWLVARLAAFDRGVALHGAGIVLDGRAWVFAGPSGSGKSTAVRMAAPGTSLGDDFAVIVPTESGWGVPAVPFDNAEAAPAAPPRTIAPLGGILRLFHAAEERIERPGGPLANASLKACTAFPWALPDLAARIEDAVDRLVASPAFAHLHFALDRPFVHLLRGAS